MPRLEDAFREAVILKTGDDIAEPVPEKNDAITLAILSLLTILLQQMKKDISPNISSGVEPSAG